MTKDRFRLHRRKGKIYSRHHSHAFLLESVFNAAAKVIRRQNRHKRSSLPLHIQTEFHQVPVREYSNQRLISNRAPIKVKRAVFGHYLYLLREPGEGSPDRLQLRMAVQVVDKLLQEFAGKADWVVHALYLRIEFDESRRQVKFVVPDQKLQKIVVGGAGKIFDERRSLAPLTLREQRGEFWILFEADYPGDVPPISGSAIQFDGVHSVLRGSRQDLSLDISKPLGQVDPLVPW